MGRLSRRPVHRISCVNLGGIEGRRHVNISGVFIRQGIDNKVSPHEVEACLQVAA